MRSEFTRGTALLATLAGIPSSVATLTVTTVTSVTTTATTKRPPLALALAHHAAGRSVGSLLLDVGSRNDLGGQVKPFPEVVEALGGQGVVVYMGISQIISAKVLPSAVCEYIRWHVDVQYCQENWVLT